ncbi:hypothetical protein JOE58_003018 [Curtobacterium luteum]|uniref:Uncharacterized protein n=1 Tax=Curtobacterium luteum TaxID=33881 RepID=A0A8H9GAG3_9MICO|nr:hypothetical protein [Curtobacterium luteum]MBM7803767.1 hypothetical protein [Curtobacterium luteum]NUU51509.1 hypothetical protein [Curtobacterium luteum]GGL02683.1 hypothetical protein GCM10009769_20980 [Curtobacterium luteum]
MTKLLSNPVFAIAVTIGLLIVGAAVAAATVGTPDQIAGSFAVALAAGAGGCYVGTTIRHRRRSRQQHH